MKKCESYREIEFMDNVIRLSKFVKNLGIVTTVLFFNNRTGNICYRKYGGLRYVLCLLYF